VDSATLQGLPTPRRMAEVLVTVVGPAGVAVFAEVSDQALAGVVDTAEASHTEPFIRHGVPASMARRTGPRPAIPMG
jgi:hypothetical protein